MPIPTEPPVAYAPLFELERDRLLELLTGLSPDDWWRQTPCPAWNIHELACHLLGVDFAGVSWLRDGHRGTVPPDGLTEQGFIDWLDQLQLDWVDAARRLSPHLVVELLAWNGPRLAATIAGQDPRSVTAGVSWASTAPVPVWLDQVRELSEQWIHRQQLLQALDRRVDLRSDLARAVLDGLRWAYPFRLAALHRPAGSTVAIEVRGPVDVRWHVVHDDDGWSFAGQPGRPIIARLSMSTDQAWRLLTNNLAPDHGEPEAEGDHEIIATLRNTRSIIGTPT